MGRKPSLLILGLSLGLLWLVSITIDELSPDLNLFVHILLTITISSIIMSVVTSLVTMWKENHAFFKQHEVDVMKMLDKGMSMNQIALELNSRKAARNPQSAASLPPGEELSKAYDNLMETPLAIYAVTEICGYYNDTPIHEKLQLTDGSIFVYDGIIDMSKKIMPGMLDKSCIVLSSGLIYKQEVK